MDNSATFSQSGIYRPPGESSLEDIRSYIESLPREDAPEVFGMHQNANITNQLQESTRMMDIILDVQPRISSGESGRSEEDIVEEIALCTYRDVFSLFPSVFLLFFSFSMFFVFLDCLSFSFF